jgi:hypothetical protein
MRFDKQIPLASVVIAFALITGVSSANAPRVVLGARAFAGPQGVGWGTPRPKEIFNGGDPSGLVTHIAWSTWGGAVATGSGKNAIFKPQGGYYTQLVTIQLRASDRGRCKPGGPLAYRKLSVRAPTRPGGRLGKWSSWSCAKSLCNNGF